MKKTYRACRFIVIVMWVLSAVPARADPVMARNDFFDPPVILWLTVAFALEAVCFLWILRRYRKPRFFLLWLIVMHFITYPAFLHLSIWLEMTQRIYSDVAIGIGELLAMLLEGLLTYVICRFIPSAKSRESAPRITKCLQASLIGNLASAIALPVLRNHLFF